MATTNNSIHVLHVDDEPGLTKLVADFLEREDDRITVDTATSASEGLDRVTEGSFDCIVSDYDMPGQNVIEFLETLREEFPHLPFILYTGKGSEEVASDAISAGATDYLQKGTGTVQYELLANRIQNAVEQSRAQQRTGELERIRTLVNDVNQALIRANSRSEVETRVCEIITESEPYHFAWIGEVDAETNRVEPRTWGGVEEGYLEEVSLTTDKTATGRGPTGTAIRERRVTVSQKVAEDPDFTWQEAAVDRGYRAMAAVPLEYGDKLYGGLNVYADRPEAFSREEQEVLAELGNDIGHAIHAVEVKDNLERARQQAEQYFGAAGNIMVVLNRDGSTARVNDRVCDLLGYERSKLVGSDWFDLVIPGTIEGEISDIFSAFWSEEADLIQKNVNPIESKDGEQIIVKWHNTALRDQEGNVIGILSSGVDITKRQERKQKLERFKNAVDHAGHAVFVTDSVGTINYVNPAFETITGYSADEAVGRNPRILKSGEMSDEYYEELWETLLDGAVWEEEVINRQQNGELYYAHQTIAPILNESGDIQEFVAIQTDITERKKREEALESSRETYHGLFYGILDAVFVHEPRGDFIDINEAACDRLGYSEDELLELSPEDIDAPEYADHAIDKIGTIEEEGALTFETVHLTKSGERIPVDVASSKIQYFGKDAILSVARDITMRKQKEKELERQNEQLNQFANVVSHDLRNPLNVVQGRINLAQEECDTKHLDAAARGVERSHDLIEDMLKLARAGQEISETETVALADLAEICWETVETADAKVRVDFDSPLRADRARLRQLLENLFRNAVEHGGADVTVMIGALPEGFYVEDDGTGIAHEERQEIWESGYSGTDHGTGFGLAIVKQIVEAHGWDVRITESSDGGARFEFAGVEVVAE